MNENNVNNVYYPEEIFMKDGRVVTQNSFNNQSNQNTSQNENKNTPQRNFLSNLFPQFSDKNLSDLLPLLLGKNKMNGADIMSSLLGTQKKEVSKQSEKVSKKNNSPQKFIEEL